jgi:hypothetical protein
MVASRHLLVVISAVSDSKPQDPQFRGSLLTPLLVSVPLLLHFTASATQPYCFSFLLLFFSLICRACDTCERHSIFGAALIYEKHISYFFLGTFQTALGVN